jgi:hypothetical protein
MLLYLWFGDYKQTQHHTAFHIFFWVSCVFNMLWIFFTYETSYLASVFAIFWLGVVLWKLFAIVLSHRTNRWKYSFLVTLPISLYLSWVLTASSVIATSQLVFLYIPSIAVSIVWQLGALWLGLLVGLLAWHRFRFDSVVAMLLLWLGGVAIKNFSTHPLLAIASVFAIVVIATVVSRNAIIQKK